MSESIECVVIGAGAVGLATARALALAGHEVVVLEAGPAIGAGVSSRSSEVIHAGMYYPAGSLKARFCVAGNRMLTDYAVRRGVPMAAVGKLIVAADGADERILRHILDQGRANGVALEALTAERARAMEPELACTAALYSPATGIIDSHALMLSLQGEAEEHGTVLAFRSPVLGGTAGEAGITLDVGGNEPTRLTARSVVVASGLSAPAVARSLGLRGAPAGYFCKGSYFALTGKTPFSRLVYPVPATAGLGIHYTFDLGGRARFGPDVEWIDRIDHSVDPARRDNFVTAIRRYWPAVEDRRLEPAYAGIRPKIQAPGEPARDFLIHGPRDHGIPGVVALYGIESPGLTACLPLAGYVVRELTA